MGKKLQRAAERQGYHPPRCIDVGCVIHSSTYGWQYVERLYNMVCRHLPYDVRFHVWTEHDRSVPPHMVKHILDDWPGISGPKRSWWYKLQLFNSAHHCGDLLYFDLDSVIVGDISWTVENSPQYFHVLRDFRYLQKPNHSSMNSSLMWFNVEQFQSVWQDFAATDIVSTCRAYQGDQDYINAKIPHNHKRFYDTQRIASYRWQVKEGGWDFRRRCVVSPGTESQLHPDTSLVVFHGHPKPHQCQDAFVIDHWR